MNRTARAALVLGVAALAIGCERSTPSVPEPEAALLAVGAPAESGGLRATLRSGPATITTAQRLELELTVEVPGGRTLEEPDLGAALPAGLTIARQEHDSTPQEGGATTERRVWLLEPFLPGKLEVPALELRAIKEGAPPLTVRTTPLMVTVESVLTTQAEKEGLAPEKTIVDPPEAPRWWLLALAMGAVAVAATGLWLIARRRAHRASAPIHRTAHELALERLVELESRRLVDSGRLKEFYEAASLILRRYIEDRFGLHAPEQTTEEFLGECQSAPELTASDVGLLERFLRHCDMVKFAAMIPSGEQARAITGTIREFVERTRRDDHLVEIAPESAEKEPAA